LRRVTQARRVSLPVLAAAIWAKKSVQTFSRRAHSAMSLRRDSMKSKAGRWADTGEAYGE
jgi:hypothetical protein